MNAHEEASRQFYSLLNLRSSAVHHAATARVARDTLRGALNHGKGRQQRIERLHES
jgi:hypothetical protein